MKQWSKALKRLFAFRFTGLSLTWSVYFLFKFGLHILGFIAFSIPLNLLLCFALCVKFVKRRLNQPYRALTALAAIALLYHDTYLPSLGQIAAQKDNIAGFSLSYILEFLQGFINLNMVYALLLLVVLVFFLKDWIRMTTVVFTLFLVVGAGNLQTLLRAPTPELTAQTQEDEGESTLSNGDILPQRGAFTQDNLERYLNEFFAHEQQRKVRLPEALKPDYEPFNIVLVNICSLADDDLAATGLNMHPVFAKFDLTFKRFNGATSYSTPASLRLLRMSCGQESEHTMYQGRREECEILTQLTQLGFTSSVFMDHNGEYGNYLKSLRELAGLKSSLNDLSKLGMRYRSFDGTPIYSDSDVFHQYLETMGLGDIYNNAAFFNLISLHDGNRDAKTQESVNYGTRLKKLLDDLDLFIERLEQGKRKTLLVMLPEHGAAVRGDKMQMARLREIPTAKVTKIPVYVKFIATGRDQGAMQRLEGSYSYLAISELIRRTLEENYFAPQAKADLSTLTDDLPQTAFVSESTNAFFMIFRNKDYFRLKDGEWTEYVY